VQHTGFTPHLLEQTARKEKELI